MNAKRLALSFLLFAQMLLACAAEPTFTLPAGFTIERVAGPPDAQFPMFACLDERRRLFVAESSGLDLYAELQKLTHKCRISVLEDRDGNGRFEHGQIFADQLVFPMGLAWRSGKLYVADPPDLITLEDTDGDGRADKRTVLLSGFGHKDNGSLHGLTFGPDGWLYLTMGQPDGYKLKRGDGTVLEGKSGALLRCRPDGSDVEVISRGFENLVEIEFMPGGEIIGTDNWFSLPAAGVRDALVHLVEGGVYPLNAHTRTEAGLFNSGDLLPSLAIYPAVALSGLVRYRGTNFPNSIRGSLFSAQFNARKVVRHTLTRFGSTFQSTDEDFVGTEDPDFHPSDVLEDDDGSLIVVDTGSWYVHHCPTGRIRKAPAQGGVYRVRYGQPGDATQPDKSRREETLIFKSPIDQSLLASATTDAETAARSARALGRIGDKSAEPALIPLLARPEPYVRMAAAEALARCGSSNAVPALLSALASDTDRFLEHALTYTLHRLADGRALSAALEHPHPRVQKAALTLLHQTPHQTLTAEAVINRIFAEDEALRRAARTILLQHSEWVVHATPLMRFLIAKEPHIPPEADTLRELILAFQTNGPVQLIIAKAATNTSLSAGRREFLIEALGRTTVAPLPDVWVQALAHALREGEPSVRLQAARTAGRSKVAVLDDTLASLVAQTNLATDLRLEALRATVGRRPQLTAAALELLLSQVSRQSAPGSRLAAAELLGRSRWPDPEMDPPRLVAAVRGDRLISPSTLLPLLIQGTDQGFAALWSYVTEAVTQGWQPTEKEWQLFRTRVPRVGEKQFQELMRVVAQRAANQREQIDSYAELLTGGDPGRGRQWFSEKAGCAACHRVGGQGGLLGPDLTKIGAIRAGRDLIESIVLPSATFAQSYDTFAVTLSDGEELTGVRVRQPDDSFVLRDAGGGETRLDPRLVKSTERLQVSLMPEGLLAALSREEIRDLLAYLQNLK
jgi:putative membrane-bound dehydrogenase-like protein